jgi:hypothetical protein
MRFLLGYGSCGIASGADFVLEGLNEVLKDTEYSVEKVGCNGLCLLSKCHSSTRQRG